MSEIKRIPCDECGGVGYVKIGAADSFYVEAAGKKQMKLCDKCLGIGDVDFIENIVGAQWIHIPIHPYGQNTIKLSASPHPPPKIMPGTIIYRVPENKHFQYDGTDWELMEQNKKE